MTSFGLIMRYSGPGQVYSKHHTYGLVLPSKKEIISVAQYVCKFIHQGPGTGFFRVKNNLASDLLKGIVMITIMFNVVRGQQQQLRKLGIIMFAT